MGESIESRQRHVLQEAFIMLTLHGPATSPFVRKTWIALKEKGLEFAHRELDPLAKRHVFSR